MSSRRVLKVAQAIREVVSLGILMDIKDPRVSDVTVTYVEVSGDLRIAKVHVSIMGDEKKQTLCLRGLQSSRGFLQKKVGNRIDTKYVPAIQFVLDKGIKNATLVTKILDEVLPAKVPIEESANNDSAATMDQSEVGFESTIDDESLKDPSEMSNEVNEEPDTGS